MRARAFPFSPFFSRSSALFRGAERSDLGVQAGRPCEKGGGVRGGESVVWFLEVEGRGGREVNLEFWRPLAGIVPLTPL